MPLLSKLVCVPSHRKRTILLTGVLASSKGTALPPPPVPSSRCMLTQAQEMASGQNWFLVLLL